MHTTYSGGGVGFRNRAVGVEGVLHGGQSNQWTSAGTLIPIVVGTVLLALLELSESRHTDPLADVRLFFTHDSVLPLQPRTLVL